MELNDLASRLAEVARLSGSFRLRSGQTASVYFDKYQFESDPELLGAVAEAMVDLIPDDTELLAGLELGGVPVATALALASGLHVVFVRKKRKEYGTAKLAEGSSIKGKRLLVVEDVVTTGGQVVSSTQQLRERGAVVTTAACVIDREEGGAEALAEIGVTLKPLFRRSDLG
ncbi:MAG: orotate phosphoribosyltransferase [Acidimicrobiia bacterium]